MPRHAAAISAETIDTVLEGVTAGRSLAAMCRLHQLTRTTLVDRLSRDAELATRFDAARASGKLVRSSRPRTRCARAAGEVVHADRVPRNAAAARGRARGCRGANSDGFRDPLRSVPRPECNRLVHQRPHRISC
jgi:hypothetical protein